MRPKHSAFDKKASSGVMFLFAIVATFTWLGLSGAAAMAGEVKDKHQKAKAAAVEPPAAKVTKKAAAGIALKRVPGTVTAVDIEKKGDRSLYAVEIIAADGGKETDVFVDASTGEVVGTD